MLFVRYRISQASATSTHNILRYPSFLIVQTQHQQHHHIPTLHKQARGVTHKISLWRRSYQQLFWLMPIQFCNYSRPFSAFTFALHGARRGYHKQLDQTEYTFSREEESCSTNERKDEETKVKGGKSRRAHRAQMEEIPAVSMQIQSIRFRGFGLIMGFCY